MRKNFNGEYFIENDPTIWTPTMNFGQYAERLICKALNIEHMGRQGERDGQTGRGKTVEIKAFEYRIGANKSPQYARANGFFTDKKISLAKQVKDYIKDIDYLAIATGNRKDPTIKVEILKNKTDIFNYLYYRIKVEDNGKARFVYKPMDCDIENDYRTKMRFNTIVKKGYIL